MKFFFFLFLALLLCCSCSDSDSDYGSESDGLDVQAGHLSLKSNCLEALHVSVSEITEILSSHGSEVLEINLESIEFNDLNEFNDFMKELTLLTVLKDVTLHSCHLTMMMARKLFALLEKKPLESLEVDYTHFPDFVFPQTLQFLIMEEVMLSKASLASLASIVKEGTALSHMNLENVTIGDESLFISVLNGLRHAKLYIDFHFVFANFSLSSLAYRTLYESIEILSKRGNVILDLHGMNCTDDDIKPFFELTNKLKKKMQLDLYKNPRMGNWAVIEYMKICCISYGENQFYVPQFGLTNDSLWQMLADNISSVPILKILEVPKFYNPTLDKIILLGKAASSHPSLETLKFKMPITERGVNAVNSAIKSHCKAVNCTKKVSFVFDHITAESIGNSAPPPIPVLPSTLEEEEEGENSLDEKEKSLDEEKEKSLDKTEEKSLDKKEEKSLDEKEKSLDKKEENSINESNAEKSEYKKDEESRSKEKSPEEEDMSQEKSLPPENEISDEQQEHRRRIYPSPILRFPPQSTESQSSDNVLADSDSKNITSTNSGTFLIYQTTLLIASFYFSILFQ